MIQEGTSTTGKTQENTGGIQEKIITGKLQDTRVYAQDTAGYGRIRQDTTGYQNTMV